MGRVLLISIFLLVLPFITYGLYARIVQGRNSAGTWSDAPIVWLGTAGVVLAVAGLIGLVYITGM